MNKKKIIGIIISAVLFIILTFLIIFATKQYSSKYDGTITIEVVELDGNIVKTKKIKFTANDKLRDLVNSNFDNFILEESEYGAYVIGIESIKQDNDAHIYIALFYNGEYATSGLDTLKFEDGSIISFKALKW